MTQTTKIKAGESAKTITLPEGLALIITGGAGALGVAYHLDPVLGGTNSLKSWAIGTGALAAPIGPFANSQKIHITCQVGSIDATVQDAVLSVTGGAIAAVITGSGIVGQPLTATLPAGVIGTLQFTKTLLASPFTKSNIATAVANAVNSLQYTPSQADLLYRIGCDASNTVAPSVGVTLTAAPSSDVAPTVATQAAIVGQPTVNVPMVITAATFNGSPAPTGTRTIKMGAAVVVTGNLTTTYTPLQADVGKAPTVEDVGTNTAGSATSTATGAAVAAAAVPRLKPVGTDRGALPNTFGTSSQLAFMQCRSRHVAHDRLTAPIVDFTGAYPNGASDTSIGSEGTIFGASIEYPPGNFTQAFFAGNSASAAINGTSITSTLATALATPIPDGAPYFVNVYLQWTSGNKPYYDDGLSQNWGPESGEVMRASTTAQTNYTMQSGLTQGGITGGGSFRPCSIRDISSKTTAFIMGDSKARRTIGIDGHRGPRGLLGEVARAVGVRMACINAAVSGDSYFNIKQEGAYSIRKELCDMCDIIIDEYGTNDLGTGTVVSVASFSNSINIMRAKLGATKPYYRTTITPRSNSTDFYTSLAGQTAVNSTPSRIAFNDAVRSNSLILDNPMAGYFETADAVESSRNSGLIIVGNSRIANDLTIEIGATSLTSATPRFSAADVGQYIHFTGTRYTSLIVAYVSPTQVTIKQTPAAAQVAGDNAVIGPVVDPSGTFPGLHFWPDGELRMAADPSWNQLGPAVYA